MNTGKVWLVGAGPSDEGLFTLKGKRVLEQADVVVYDQLVGDGIMRMIPTNAECIDVGKHAGNHKVVQERINEILLEEAQKGKAKKRESGGDRQAAGQGEEKAESPPDRRRYPRRAERRMARHTRGAAPRRTPYPDRSHACEHRAGGRKSRQHGGMVRLGQRRRVDGDAVAGENGAYAGSSGSYGDGFQRL